MQPRKSMVEQTIIKLTIPRLWLYFVVKKCLKKHSRLLNTASFQPSTILHLSALDGQSLNSLKRGSDKCSLLTHAHR